MRRIKASDASQSRAAFSATISNTGWISVGELAMTPQDLTRGSLLLQRLGQMRFVPAVP